ncbi:MAG TPA: aspartate aminotransferase family protein, partial [Plasticicumulans sp.]|nr:aspartate aminotransferase family protein [Plasticicumulans sp.]
MTDAAYARMFALAGQLQHGLERLIGRYRLPCCVVRLGARQELVFRPQPPRSAAESLAAADPALERLLHLYWLNRGVLVTPFHNMLLLSPEHREADLERLLDVLDAALGELTGAAS